MRKLFIFLLPVFVLFSCTDFFSTSLASWAARDKDKLVPAVTTDNVDDLIALAENDPDLSLALLKKIKEAAEGASGEEKQKLQNAALEAAVNAAGLGQAVIGAMGDLSNVDNEEEVKQLVLDALNSMANLDSAEDILFDILDGDFDPNEADPNNMVMAAVILMAGEAKKAASGIDEYLEYFDPQDPQLSPEAQLAVDLALAAKDRVTGPIADILNGLNLIF